MVYLGIDLGGTNLKGAVVDDQGAVQQEIVCQTHAQAGPEHVAEQIAGMIRRLSTPYAPKDIGGIGIGCPGTVDDDAGIIRYSNNLKWADFNIRSVLRKCTGWSVRLVNDANAAALGEAFAGCGKDAESVVVLTLGTGVGSGIVLHGKLLTGYTGAAAEAGHMVIAADGEPCSCGRKGCLETYASATALIRMTEESMARHPESAMHTISRAAGGVDGKTAFVARQAGDPAGTEVVERYIRFLAIGTANLINIFYPEVIAFSGGIANQGEQLFEPLRQQVYPLIFGGAGEGRKRTRITQCVLGYRAGMIGAAMLCRED